MIATLKPCPHCAARARVIPVDVEGWDQDHKGWIGACTSDRCLARGPVRRTAAEAEEAYNSRATGAQS